MKKLTAERLRELLEYDSETGVFRWRVKSGSKSAGSIAGTLHKNGYCTKIMVDRKGFAAHRLAWLYMTGEWPALEVDHKNCIGTDNRWSNLRLVTRHENMQNKRRAHRNNKTGFLGVSIQDGRYRADIYDSGKHRFLGFHDTPEQAHAVYVDAKRIMHPGSTL